MRKTEEKSSIFFIILPISYYSKMQEKLSVFFRTGSDWTGRSSIEQAANIVPKMRKKEV
jgi:hypothetical protein